MYSFSILDIQLTMAIGLFLVGLITFFIGVYLLIARTAGKEVASIAAQTTRLAQKGLAEEISGLVGNASSLLNALNDLVRTSAGIGIFLILTGCVLMVSGVLIALKIQ